jgi:6-phosphofructokinase
MRIGILTGGGDVPGLNPAIRAVTLRAIREGHEVIGLRRGWSGITDLVREKDYDNSNNFLPLTANVVNKVSRTGGTFLHTSRTRPSHMAKKEVPTHLRDKYNAELNDLTEEVLKNLEWLGINYLIPIGGDDTLSYGAHLFNQGFKVIAIPKTMDGDVPGTDYTIGFSTCVSRTIELTHALRTSAGSHERFLVIEVFGRYAGFSALVPAMAGASDRCVIPECEFEIENLCELMTEDRQQNPSHYSVVLVSEGAIFKGIDMVFKDSETDAYGHKKLGGIGDIVARQLRELSPKFNRGEKVNTIVQNLGYLVRSGAPDAIDSLVPMAFGNIALNLILDGRSGLLVNLHNGKYGSAPLNVVTSYKKIVNVEEFYNTQRLCPKYKNFEGQSFFITTSDPD